MRLTGAFCYSHETPELWTDVGGKGVDPSVAATAKKLCKTKCLVTDECEAAAKQLLRTGKDIRGVWGGKTTGALRKEIKNESIPTTTGGSSH